jgi:hypothetical protein
MMDETMDITQSNKGESYPIKQYRSCLIICSHLPAAPVPDPAPVTITVLWANCNQDMTVRTLDYHYYSYYYTFKLGSNRNQTEKCHQKHASSENKLNISHSASRKFDDTRDWSDCPIQSRKIESNESSKSSLRHTPRPCSSLARNDEG